jgi:hypothetical protein
MKNYALIGIAAASLLIALSGAARADAVRHSPDAHMDQNASRYRYDYDDGVCYYRYEYDFKTLKDRLDQKGDCRNVPIQRFRPQAAIAPAYPPPAAAPPISAPASTGLTTIAPPPAPPMAGVPSVTVGPPALETAPHAPAGISVTPVP